jgi:hypothetical protein
LSETLARLVNPKFINSRYQIPGLRFKPPCESTLATGHEDPFAAAERAYRVIDLTPRIPMACSPISSPFAFKSSTSRPPRPLSGENNIVRRIGCDHFQNEVVAHMHCGVQAKKVNTNVAGFSAATEVGDHNTRTAASAMNFLL